MKKRWSIFCLVIVVGLCVHTEAKAVGKHALLIAIQEYNGDDPLLPSLNGPLNDLKIVGKILQERFGLQPADFMILMDEEATHTGIEDAFSQLIERVQPGDFVYIHYSGHGSQAKDLNGDERSGKDQTWVPYGARMGIYDGKDDYDVLDDELDAYLSAVYARTDQLIFVSDSCHSATVSRGDAVASRAVRDDVRANPAGRLTYTPLAIHRGIRIGAARDHESAIEFRPEVDKYYGVFTWYWVQALQQARSGETWNDVFKRAYTLVTAGRGAIQRPQMTGERCWEVLGGAFREMTPTIQVKQVEGDVIILEAGILSGVAEGSVYRLYQPDTPNSQSLPRLTITHVAPFESTGKGQGNFSIGDAVVEESHAYHFQPIQVSLQADFPESADQPLLQKIRAAFNPPSETNSMFPAYALTHDPQQAEIHLYLLRPKVDAAGQYVVASTGDALPASFPHQLPEVWVLSPEHRLLYDLRIPFANPAQGLQQLQDALNGLARIKELKALRSPRSSKLSVAVEVYPVEYCQDGPECLVWHDNPGVPGLRPTSPPVSWHTLQEQIVSRDARFSFRFHNTSPHDYYCYLLDITPQGDVFAIFPAPDSAMEDALIQTGQILDLGKELVFELDAPGEETLKLIVSSQPVEVSLLEIKRFQQRGGRHGKHTPLERLLLNARYGMRGLQLHTPDTWDTDQVSFEVE